MSSWADKIGSLLATEKTHLLEIGSKKRVMYVCDGREGGGGGF